MCGRTACTLNSNQIRRACSHYNDKSKKYEAPTWEEHENQSGGKTYSPSYNVCPTDVTPVLISKNEERILTPMVWGMIPPWHKGSYKDHKLSTNNCRIESVLESRLYKTPMITGHRCVVVCDGFYEWQTTKGEKDKQAYFVHAPQRDGVRIDDPESWKDEWSENEGWKGPKLLAMAGLYNIWTSPQGEKFFSYSVVTMESDPFFGWLHHRVPAILDSKEAINEWLSGEDSNKLLTKLTPNRPLSWHPVSSRVNNSRDKSVGLNRAVEIYDYFLTKIRYVPHSDVQLQLKHTVTCLMAGSFPTQIQKLHRVLAGIPISTKKRLSKSATFMNDWLKGSKRKRDDEESTPSKKDKNDSS